jgi:hypothetical protein
VKAERGVMGSRPTCPAARPLMAWQSLPLASPPGKAHRHWEQAWWRRLTVRLPVSYAEVSTLGGGVAAAVAKGLSSPWTGDPCKPELGGLLDGK